jgi:hypothetical protein
MSKQNNPQDIPETIPTPTPAPESEPQQQAQPAPQAPVQQAQGLTIPNEVLLAFMNQQQQAQPAPSTPTPVNNQEVANMNAVNTIPSATNTEISAPAEFRQALANQGLNEYGLLQQVSAGVGAGAISRASVNTAVRQGELMAKLSRQQQREAERAAWVAQRKAELNSRFGNTDLTVGQTILLGVGIVATVVIIGGLVWWLIRKFRDKDAELISDGTTDGAKALNAANAAWISY